MSINGDTLQQIEDARVRLHALVDGHTQAADAAWAGAWAQLEDEWLLAAVLAASTVEDGASLSKKRIRTDERLAAAQARTDEAVASLAAAGPRQAAVRDVIALAGEAERALIGSQLPANAPLPRGLSVVSAPTAAVEALVTRFSQRMIVGWEAIPAGARATVATAMLRGFRFGDNPDETARRVAAEVRGAVMMSLSRAKVVTRTEFHDAYREGALATDTANADVLQGWVHICALDLRTCSSCLAQHGTVHPITEPGPLDHQQGRCTRGPLTKSWADLGFPDIEEPPSILPDARAWFDGLPQSDRERVMGAKRVALLDSGQVSWADLSTRRETPRWRASWVPTPVKDLQAKASRTGTGVRS